MGRAMTPGAPRDILAGLFQAAIDAADPARGIAAHLPARDGVGRRAAQLQFTFE